MKKIHIQGYEILQLMGKGDTCLVYKATQLSLGRTVVLKVLKPQLAASTPAVAKFKLESNAVNKLRHRNIAQVYKSGESNGNYYMAREFIDGGNAARRVKHRKGMPEGEALAAIEAVARALQHAWDQDELVHANLKPENILLDSDGTVKVVDFSGLTCQSSATLMHALTGAQIGNPSYSAPEFAQKDANVDFRADIYSLGALFYYLMTGEQPFGNLSRSQRIEAQANGHLPSPRDLNSSCSPAAALLARKMTIKDRDARYGSWTELIEDIALARARTMPDSEPTEHHASTIAPATTSKRRRSVSRQQMKHRIAEAAIYILIAFFVALNIYLLLELH